MRIEKVLNNNVVLSRNEQGEEIVYMGRGLSLSKEDWRHDQSRLC